jgi:hypothetical protein
LACASEITFPAAQIERGRCDVTVSYTVTDQKIILSPGGREQIAVGGASFFSTVSSDLEGNGTRKGVAAKLMVNPHDGLYYWLTAGSGPYELQVPSTTVTNTYSTRDNGMFVGGGVRKVLFPDTLFTPALAVEAGIRYDSYALDRLKQGSGTTQRIGAKLELTEIQAALLMSKAFRRFEPYGGLKIFRTYAQISDRETLQSVSGIKDNAGLFLGVRCKLYPREYVSLEAGFAGETSISAGLNVEF